MDEEVSECARKMIVESRIAANDYDPEPASPCVKEVEDQDPVQVHLHLHLHLHEGTKDYDPDNDAAR